MTDLIAKLRSNIHTIASNIPNHIRTAGQSTQNIKVGYGQFLDTNAHAEQIGTYGICAAFLAISIGAREETINPDVISTIICFWNQAKKGNKLYEQNIRLAFWVLSLARTAIPDLIDLRNKVTKLLLERKAEYNDSVAWSDWRNDPEQSPEPRLEITAWAVIALTRLQEPDVRKCAIAGARYLAEEVANSGDRGKPSPMVIAAIVRHKDEIKAENKKNWSAVARHARKIIGNASAGDLQNIAYFDYITYDNGTKRLGRDFLCYPNFYPMAIIMGAFSSWRHPVVAAWTSIKRTELINSLINATSQGIFYRQPGAVAASTLDQALIALTYEELSSSYAKLDPIIKIINSFYIKLTNNFVFRFAVPIVFLVVLITMARFPDMIPIIIAKKTGYKLTFWIKTFKNHSDIIKIISVTVLAIAPSLPAAPYRYVRDKFRRDY